MPVVSTEFLTLRDIISTYRHHSYPAGLWLCTISLITLYSSCVSMYICVFHTVCDISHVYVVYLLNKKEILFLYTLWAVFTRTIFALTISKYFIHNEIYWKVAKMWQFFIKLFRYLSSCKSNNNAFKR